jgi:hypothetical protein
LTVRVIALVEGQTEETFVRRLLAPMLGVHGVAISATTYGRRRSHGGVPRWGKAERELLRLVKEDTGRLVTTMFDYYGLPGDWPGREAIAGKPPGAKARILEQAMHGRILESLGDHPDRSRFIPYIQMHEFEALLFSEPKTLGEVLTRDARPRRIIHALQQVAGEFATPEEIDDGQTTAPSKRIRSLANHYQKVTDGNLAATRIGLEAMRQRCPHFDQWLGSLEMLSRHHRASHG